MKINFIKRFFFVLIQCTYGLGQTVMGFFVFLYFIRKPHRIYRGCIDTMWDTCSGLSPGLFIFTPKMEFKESQEIRVHEYGHCIQSLFLGPLYLFVGIISVTWAGLPYFVKMRREKHIPYTACFVEHWASSWGEWVTKEKAVWN